MFYTCIYLTRVCGMKSFNLANASIDEIDPAKATIDEEQSLQKKGHEPSYTHTSWLSFGPTPDL